MICLANAIKKYDLKAEIVIVISNKFCAGIQLAQDLDLPNQIISRRNFDSQTHQESAIAAAITYHQADYVFLAGYMAILGNRFVKRFSGRLLNIHPSLLPAFKGLNTHQRAIDNNVLTHGVSVHLVTTALDDGPMVLQASLLIHPDDTANRLATRVLELEHQIYPFVLFGLARQFLSLSPEGALWRLPAPAFADKTIPLQDTLVPYLIWPKPV